jgi:hypothetical protein
MGLLSLRLRRERTVQVEINPALITTDSGAMVLSKDS